MDRALDLLLQPATRLTRFDDPFAAWSLLAAAVVALVAFLLSPAGRRRPLLALRWLMSAKLWMHRSTRLDAKLYLLNSLVLAGGVVLSAAVLVAVRGGGGELLAAVFGPPAATMPSFWPVLGATVLSVVALDLSYYLVHRAMHDSPLLWAFHKVHHSAEVMTPLTEWRQHPLEVILFGLGAGVLVGAAQAVAVALWGAGALVLAIEGVNVLTLAYAATLLHLRHSHVWLPLRGWLGRLLHSPAHHQLHHSTAPEHAGVNLGFALSVFDWAFGTLCLPARRRPRLTFGVEGERCDQTVVESLVQPFREAWAVASPLPLEGGGAGGGGGGLAGMPRR